MDQFGRENYLIRHNSIRSSAKMTQGSKQKLDFLRCLEETLYLLVSFSLKREVWSQRGACIHTYIYSIFFLSRNEIGKQTGLVDFFFEEV